MVSATRVPNRGAICCATGFHGLSRVWDRSITPSLSLASSGFGRDASRPLRAQPITPLCPSRRRCRARVVVLAADHQLPGDAGHLVGQRHGGQLGRLALEELEEPGRGHGLCRAGLLDHRGRPDHQHAAQGLVAGPGDPAQPRLAGGGMVLRRQPDPGRELPAGAEGLRIGRLHHQHRGADRPDAGDLRQAPAELVGAMPGHQLGLDRLHLACSLGVFPGIAAQTSPAPAPAASHPLRSRASSGSILSSPLAATRPNSAA